MKPPSPSPSTAPGNSIVPVLLIVGALIISGLVFFFFTRPNLIRQKSDNLTQIEPPQSVLHNPAPDSVKPPAATGNASTGPMPNPAISPSTLPAPQSVPQMQSGFSKPSEVGDTIARALASGDIAAAAKVLSGGQASQELAARSLLDNLTKMGYKAGPPEQVRVVGQIDGLMRLSIPLIDTKTGKLSASPLLIEVEPDARMGYKVARVRVPKELEAAVGPAMVAANAPVASTPAGTAADPAAPASKPATVVAPGIKPLVVVDEKPDALSHASDFVSALQRLDYDAARKLVDDQKVPAVKLAALCMIFEDSKYQLLETRPLVSTVTTDATSWIIAHIRSDLLKEETEFGLELELADGKWRIGGVNLSKMLADSAKSSSVAGIPYTPLLQNPKGGESIALYFELDQAVLHPRAQKQLDVVVQILKSASHKKLKITGHTDALGSDAYNIALSQNRALAVKEYILVHGVPVDQVETIGFGKTLPLSPNVRPDGSDNPEGRSRNRRAEILLDF
jgi:OOP family OmpA-OmpF porin